MKIISKDKISAFLKKYWIGILAAVLVIAVIASSVEIYKEEVLNIDPDIEYKEQSTLYLPSENIDTFNPVISQSQDVYYLSKLIYNSLFTFDEQLNVVPELADEYTVDTERAYIEVKLKNGVKWHNGKKLTASDVAFTVSAMRAAGTNCPYYNKVKKINSAFAKGNDTVAIYFNNNYNCSLDDLTFPIVPSSQYSSAGAFVAAKDDFKPVGTGQYKYKSYNKKKQLRLTANKNYFGQKADKNITVTLLPDRDLASNMMEINSVTCYVDSSSNRKSSASDRGYQILDIPSNNVEFLVFNTRSSALSQKDMRKALAYGIDVSKILDNAYMGDGILTDTIYYPNYLGVTDTLKEYSYDLKKAEQLVSSLGFRDVNGDGAKENPQGQKFTLKILVDKKNATRNSAAQIIKNNLDTLGLDAYVESLPRAEYNQAIKRKDFDILVTGFTIEENYDLRNFFNGSNDWGYYNYDLFMKSRELDRLYTPDEYRAKYRELKDALIDELPYYPLCYKKMSLIGVDTFKAEKLPMFNNIYKNCDTWSWSVIVEKNNDEEDKNTLKN